MSSPQVPNPKSQPQIQTGSTVPVHGCAACHQVFPENMMAAVGARWVCLLCKERALEDPMATERAKYRMSSYVPSYTKWIVILTVLAWGIHFGVGLFFENAKVSARQTLAPQKPPQAAAAWAAKPPTEWPVMVAEAAADFKSPIFVAGPRAFFVENDDGGLLSLTTVELAPNAGVKDGEINPERLESELVEWRVGSGDKTLKFSKMKPSDEIAFSEGVVVLPAPEGTKAPISPITLRKSNYRAGAPAFAVTRDAKGGQVVHHGNILDNDSADGSTDITSLTFGRQRILVATGDGSATRVHFDEALKVGDLVGAALVDSDGLLMAIITAPQAEMPRDAKTKTFLAFGMKALQETINPSVSVKRPMERGMKK